MTVRNPPSFLQAITDPAAGYSAANDRLTLGAAYYPGSPALAARSGILPAATNGMGEVSVISNTVIRVQSFRAIIQGTRAGAQGQYTVVNDAAVDRAIGATAAGVQRRDLLAIVVRDTGYAPDTQDNADVVVIPGAPHATAPVEPAMGGTNLGNYLVLGVINVPATGGTVTFTSRWSLTVAVGGIRPVPAADTTPGVYLGQYRDDPTLGPQRWDGTNWRAAQGASAGCRWTMPAAGGAGNQLVWGPGFPQVNSQWGATFTAVSDGLGISRGGVYLASWSLNVPAGMNPRSFLEINAPSMGTRAVAAGSAGESDASITSVVMLNDNEIMAFKFYVTLPGSGQFTAQGRLFRIADVF